MGDISILGYFLAFLFSFSIGYVISYNWGYRSSEEELFKRRFIVMEYWQTLLLPFLFGSVVGYSVGKIRALGKIVKKYKGKIENLAVELFEEKLRREAQVAEEKGET